MENDRRISDNNYMEIIERLTRLESMFKAHESFDEASHASGMLQIRETMAASDKAIQKAEHAMDRRLESLNEFRGQLRDQAGEFLTRREYNAGHDALTLRMSEILSRVDKSGGVEKGLSVGWIILIGMVGIITSLISLVMIRK
jgi:hypothetical protein